jgi:hypothetical protein
MIDLLHLRIEPFRYGGTAERDDFPTVVDRLCACPTLIFATPVYWYAMSGLMKNLFDRFTDLLGRGEAGARGRALEGRRTWLLATGTDPELPDGFEIPFESSSAYLGMAWQGACYAQVTPPDHLGDLALAAVDSFARRIVEDMKGRGRPAGLPSTEGQEVAPTEVGVGSPLSELPTRSW